MIEYVLEPAPIDQDSLAPTKIPSSSEPLIETEAIIPEGLTSAQNGIMPVEFLKKIHCGGSLYTDAARSWLAMVRAASLDGIFLNVNLPFNTYRSIVNQRKSFQARFEEIDPQSENPDGALRVEFEDKTWQLRADKVPIAVPGQSLHGFGLAVIIANRKWAGVQDWLDQNAEQFGFVKGWGCDPLSYVYIKSRESIPDRVLEIESLPPLPSCSAYQIAKVGGGKWLKEPSEAWRCSGIMSSKPYRPGTLAVVSQGGNAGIKADMIRKFFRQLAGLICTDPKELEDIKLPILVTKDIKGTTDKLSKMFEDEAQKIEIAGADNAVTAPAELTFYRKLDPEATIFLRKKALTKRLLEISIDDLKNATDQKWYEEYIELLTIRLQAPPLLVLAKQYCGELSDWYNKHSKEETREIAVLCLIQFIDPMELTIPFNQDLWSEQMRADVRSAILGQFNRVGYTDEDIAAYYLARQSTWRHGKHKPRVAFLLAPGNVSEKLIPLYRTIRERDDIESFIVAYPKENHQYSGNVWNYLHDQFPNDKIYNATGVADLRRLKPDYVFFQDPYDERRPFPGFSIKDIPKFAKLCHISYGVTLAQTFINRLVDDLGYTYRNVYLMFCSSETVKKEMIAKLPHGMAMGYQHIEFLGYPLLEVPSLPLEAHDKKRILWTPRWSYAARVGGSHFVEYKDKFIELSDRYGDKVELAMRPHPRTFSSMLKINLMTEEGLKAYKNLLKDKHIQLFLRSFDLDENFSKTDILLSDYSSILIVFFLTGRPIVYCEFVNAVMLPEYQEMLECMYVAHNWDEVVHYLDELVAGNDPLFERRQQAIKKIRETHAGASQKIIERVMADFNNCLET